MPGMGYTLEKRHPDGTITREPYETPHEYEVGDAVTQGELRWQIVELEGDRLIVEPAPSGDVA